MSTHSRQINGNLAFYSGNRRRLVDAIGADVIKYLNDFLPGVHSSGEMDLDWAVTRVETGGGESTFAIIDGAGGIARITTDAFENDGINAQAIGEAFKLASGNVLYFGARAKISEATELDFFLGLAITDTDILGGVTDRIGFEKLDGVTTIKAMLEKDSTETLSGTLATADTSYHIYEFFFDGTNVEFFIDGASAYVPVVTNLPDDEELRVSIHCLAGSAAARTMDIDYVRCIQIGGRAT